ncbi:MAG: DNA polymerase III subunit delta [Actinomycetota bacterium]
MSPASRRSNQASSLAREGSLHLIFGPEDVLADRALSHIKSVLRQGEDGIQVVRVDPDRYQLGDITMRAAPSLFDDQILLEVWNLEEASDALIAEVSEIVREIPEHVVLIVRHRSGVRGKAALDAVRAAGAVVHECPKISKDSDKAKFVVDAFRQAGRIIDRPAVAALVQAVGQDLRELNGACAQLMSDTTPEQGPPIPISVDLVHRYYGGRVEATGFAVADAAITGRTDEALALLRHALASGFDPVPLVAILARTLRTVAAVSDLQNARSADVARQLGMAPWQIDKARRQAQAWTPHALVMAISEVATADLAVKGGLPSSRRRAGDARHALERAVVHVSQAAEHTK